MEESSSSSSSSCNNGFNFGMMGSTFPNATVTQNFDQVMLVEQTSDELIWIKDSCNITVDTNDTQAAISLQVGLQLAIALVISISLGDSIEGRAVAQELFQKLDSEQTNKQKVYIDNSKDVTVTTTDTDIAVNIQALLQVLVSLVVKLDVL
ncbi:spore coat protein [Ureibacillus sp. Re31]|uniref:Spore coat protein n=2 Tax=Ureibacillus galli TaxID=2762222 RepID=A0ABR8XH74_9BACL|nr:spore coat protein [Ureibacillus galli]